LFSSKSKTPEKKLVKKLVGGFGLELNCGMKEMELIFNHKVFDTNNKFSYTSFK
jgi:hypothetical protein